MTLSEADIAAAERRMAALRSEGYAIAARYDRESDRVLVRLSTGDEVSFAPAEAEELVHATADDLTEIEILPGGLGILWPRLDAALYVPALKRGILGSRRWMAEAAGR
ncbi:DUF2442 domain-containing protein [Salinarimonas sp. NSM]|uniref:DUF2442 domain-containing protein n=1 Tax=Salinarimonas sp. NSM TaxID=3458003 RepID=UPI00403730BE